MTAPPLIAVAMLGSAIAILQLSVLPSPALVIGAVVIACCFVTRRYQVLILACGIAASLALAGGRSWQAQRLPEACERALLKLRGEVVGLVTELPSEQGVVYRFDLAALAVLREDAAAVESVQPLGHAPSTHLHSCSGPRRIRLYLNHSWGSTNELAPVIPASGDIVELSARLRRVHGYINPGAADGERQALLKNLHAVGSVRPDTLRIEARSNSLGARLTRVRDRLSQKLRERTAGKEGQLLAALAVGDQRHIGDDGWERLRQFGLTHLMVISGLHISLLALPGWWIGARLAALGPTRPDSAKAPAILSRELLPPLLALSLATSYALLAGLSLPTQRALIVISLAMVPRLCGRRISGARLLAFGAGLLFVLNPVSVIGASFFLSLTAVALLLWFSLWEQALNKEQGRELGDTRGAPSLTSGLSAVTRTQLLMLGAMVPASLFWFQAGSTLGSVVNLVAIPLTTLWIVPCLLLSLIPVYFDLSVAEPLLSLAAVPLSILWRALDYWSGHLQPLGLIRDRPITPVLLMAGLAVPILALPRFHGRKRVALALLLPLALPGADPSPDGLRVLIMDVGQGTSVLLQTRSDSVLYDTGGGPANGPPIAVRSVLPALRHAGIDDLNWLIISHPDLDHDAGEGVVRDTVRVRALLRGRVQAPSDDGRLCRLGRRERLGPQVELQFLSASRIEDTDNNASCVLLVHAYGRRILLPGDIDSRRERDLLSYWGQELKADVVLAAHHGSGSSSSRLWLRSLDPQRLIATAGKSNRFGHPAARVTQTADSMGITLLNTATDGAIALSITPDGKLSCRRYRHRQRAFWRRGNGSQSC